MQFYEKLKRLRAQKGISQAELAEKIYVSRSAVAKWENGLGLPSEQSLGLLADYFGVAPSELLSDPTAETVIVRQNNKLSKQKLWILILSGVLLFAVAAAIVFSVLYANGRKTDFFARELIFETERETDTLSIPSYYDDEISVEKPFADSRTFEIPYGTGSITLPKLLLKTTNDKDVTYEDIDYDKLVVTHSGEVLARVEESGVAVLTADYYVYECVGWVNLKYGNFIVSVKIERHKISVQSVSVRLDDDTSSIGVAQKKLLKTEILPFDAADQDFEVIVEKIVFPDGSERTDDLAAYASVANHYLEVTKSVPVGARIFLYAVAVKDNVRSDPLVIDVVRIPPESFNLRTEDMASRLQIGSTSRLTLIVRPSNATFVVLEEEATLTLLTPELAALTQGEGGWYLTVTTDKTAVGQTVSVRVKVDGIEKVFSWGILG